MSGIASAAPTIPGSVATFWSCSSERSSTIASSSSGSANTLAGTRMSGRASAGISQVVSSTRRRSDIQHDACPPGSLFMREREPVVGDRLHERPRLAGPPAHGRPKACVAEDDVRLLRHEPLRLGQEDELLEPPSQERGGIRRLKLD